MYDPDQDKFSETYGRVFRLLSAAKEEAESLRLPNLVHLTNMALLQLVVDWEGIALDDEPDAKLTTLMGKKAQIAESQAYANVSLLHEAQRL